MRKCLIYGKSALVSMGGGTLLAAGILHPYFLPLELESRCNSDAICESAYKIVIGLLLALPGLLILAFIPPSVRALVSQNKRRFEQDGFSLDLAYITKRIIAMGFPSQGIEGVYRNNIDDVVRFMETYHADCYKVYNLCSERTYDAACKARFHGRVESFPFDDHNPPPFEMIRAFCIDASNWLHAAPQNVVAVHCKAGKGRTGVMVCALLLHLFDCSSAEEALKYFSAARTYDGKGVTIMSQKRYVKYFAENLKRTREIVPARLLRLRALRIQNPPPEAKVLTVKVRNGFKRVSIDTRIGNPLELQVIFPGDGLLLSADVCFHVEYCSNVLYVGTCMVATRMRSYTYLHHMR